MKNINLFASILALIMAGCASQKPAGTAQTSKYSEDLSVWRPMVETRVDTTHAMASNNNGKQTVTPPPKYAVNPQLDGVLDSIDRIYLTRKSVEGFTIQVYSGDKDGALQAKRELSMALPDFEAELNFITPTFRVKIGQYYTRMEAQKDFLAVKRYFPNAIVIPEKIAIN